MAYEKRFMRADASLSDGRTTGLAHAGIRPLGRIVGTMAVVLLLGSSAFGEFFVQPIIMKRQVTPGARGVPLDFRIENMKADSTVRVDLRIVDLAKDANGIWMEVDPQDPNGATGSTSLPGCRDRLTCPVAKVQLDPNQVFPIRVTADVPADANGLYYAALIIETSQEPAGNGPWGGMLMRVQYLAPIILDAQTAAPGSGAASDVLKAPPQEISGRVVDPNGRPVAGAQVALTAAKLDQVMLRNGILEPRWPHDERRARFAETDAEGRFCFDGTWSHPFYLFASHSTGFAAVMGKDFQKSREIRLERWGRIEGQVAKDRRGTDGRVWMLGLVSPTWVFRECDLRYDTPCDEDGRFVFERVPAGWFNFGYLIAIGDHSEGLTSRTPVLVKAGETSHVKIGGEGRPVVGRLVAPTSYGRPLHFGAGPRSLHRLEGIERDREMANQFVEQPEDDPYFIDVGLSDPRVDIYLVEKNQQEWFSAHGDWHDGVWPVEGTIWSDMDWRGYAFRISPDGSFRIEDVIPGRYELRLILERSSRSNWLDESFAQYQGIIEVPSMTGPHTDEPFDVGALTLNVFGVGEPAPPFEAETIDGKPIRLIDHRGKFVLLGFSNPDDSGMQLVARLKELHKTYGDTGTLQIIHRISGSMMEVKQHAAEHQIEWPVICSSTMYGSPDGVGRQYHLPHQPNAVLVDPEGRIVATRLWNGLDEEGRRLMRAVRNALSPQEISGRVVDPNGRAVAGAQVALTGGGLGYATLCNGILKGEDIDYGAPSRFVETDAEGRFRFESTWSHPFYVFAAHAAGFAAMTGTDFQKNREIHLERWGRVEGQLAQGHRGADDRVWMHGLPKCVQLGSRCGLTYDASCGTDGRFVFERVPAGWFNVGYLMGIGDHLEALTARTAVVVKAGETARVKMGGEGRPVIGRFTLPASFGRSVRFGTGLCILRRSENIEREKVLQLSEEQLENDPYARDASWIYDPRTDSCATSVEENRREWWDSPWQMMDDHAELVGDGIWNDVDWRGYAFRVNPDGSFRIEDVVPGRYEVNVSLAERRAGEDFLSPFAQYHGTIEVPPTTEEHADQPFDLGILTLNVFGVGEPAPLFEGETMNAPIRLIDYRGKYVLLSLSTGEHRKTLDCLKELQKTYGRRGDFQVIGIGHDESAPEANAELAGNPIQFVLFLSGDDYGDDFREFFAKQYHLFGWPDMVLIDPQGRIAATHLWDPDGGARLMRTVREALEQREQAGTTAPQETTETRTQEKH